jgi:hypothetical protein
MSPHSAAPTLWIINGIKAGSKRYGRTIWAHDAHDKGARMKADEQRKASAIHPSACLLRPFCKNSREARSPGAKKRVALL